MFESLSLALLAAAMFFRSSRWGTALSFAGLALAIVMLRTPAKGFVGFGYATLVVLFFWVAQNIRFTVANTRRLLLITLGMGLLVYSFRDSIPFVGLGEEPDPWRAVKMDPGSIESMQSQHGQAVVLYFDHPPSEEERYFKIGSFSRTRDGLEYIAGPPQALDEDRFPETAKWTRENLKNAGGLDNTIELLKRDFTTLTYSLSPGGFHGRHPLDDFLFERREGFCQHFAAALATILHMKGYNTRVSFGFSGGVYHRLGRKLVYEMSDAHAWVEVFDPTARKWHLVDPTLWVRSSDGGGGRPPLDFTYFYAGAGLILCVLIVSGARRGDSKERLLKRLEKMERKLKLEERGWTIKERVSRLVQQAPANERDKLMARLRDYQRESFQMARDGSPVV